MPLADVTGPIPRLLELPRQHGLLNRHVVVQGAVELPVVAQELHSVPVGIATRHGGGTGRRAHGRRRREVREAAPAFRQVVHGRGLQHRVAVTAQIAPALVVGEQEDEVGTLRGLGGDRLGPLRQGGHGQGRRARGFQKVPSLHRSAAPFPLRGPAEADNPALFDNPEPLSIATDGFMSTTD